VRLDHITEAIVWTTDSTAGQSGISRHTEYSNQQIRILFGCGTAALRRVRLGPCQASLPGDHRALEPPDPIPNSVVKRRIADGSVGSPHVRVGHRQALIPKPRGSPEPRGFYFPGSCLSEAMTHSHRTRVIGACPDGESAVMLVGDRLRHIATTKWGRASTSQWIDGRSRAGGLIPCK